MSQSEMEEVVVTNSHQLTINKGRGKHGIGITTQGNTIVLKSTNNNWNKMTPTSVGVRSAQRACKERQYPCSSGLPFRSAAEWFLK